MILDRYDTGQKAYRSPFKKLVRSAYLLTKSQAPLQECDGCDVTTSLTLQYNHFRPHVQIRLRRLSQASEKICSALDGLHIVGATKETVDRKNRREIEVVFTRGHVHSLRNRRNTASSNKSFPLLQDYDALPDVTKKLADGMSTPMLMTFTISPSSVASSNLVLNESKLAEAVHDLVLKEQYVRVLVDAEDSVDHVDLFKDYLLGRKDPIKAFCPQGRENVSSFEPSLFIVNPMPPDLLGFRASLFFMSGMEYTAAGIAGMELDRAPEVKKIQRYEASAKKLILINFRGKELVKEYEGLITAPKEGEYQLQRGDTFELQYRNHGWDFSDVSWRARVLPRGSVDRQAMIPIIVYRGQHKSSLQYAEDRPDAIDARKLKSGKLQQIVEGDSGNTVMVKIVDCESTFTNKRAAYIKLLTSASREASHYCSRIRRVLLGNRPDLLGWKDLYSHIRTADFDPLKFMLPLNHRQLEVVRATSHIRGGFQFMQGPPGTGKTYTSVEVLVPFLVAPNHTIVLVAAPTNHGANDLARNIFDRVAILRRTCPEIDAKRIYALRVHPDHLEDLITRTQDRKSEVGETNTKVPDKAVLITATEMEIQHELLDAFTAADNSKFEGIHDDRVADIDYSVGHMKLLVSGVIPGSEHACTDTERYAKFRELHEKQASGKRLTVDEEKTWRTESETLTRVVLRGASVIVSTTDTISKAALLEQVEDKVAAVFMDECAYEREDSLMPLFAANFRLDPYFVMVGDHQQLTPLTKAKVEYNPFQPQLEMSFMARMIAVGMEYIMLEEQHRMTRDISEIANTLTYRGQLIDDSCTQLVNRPLARQFQDFAHRHYGLVTNRLFIDLPPSKSNKVDKNEQSSKSNEFSLCIVAELIRTLLEEFKGEATIAVLTSYKSQLYLYDVLKGKMMEMMLENFDKITFGTIDAAQGRQFDIVVCDLVVGGSAGFLESENRLNVAMTRAKDGLIVVGSSGMIGSAFYKFPTPTPYMKRMVQFFKNTTWKREHDNDYPKTEFYKITPQAKK